MFSLDLSYWFMFPFALCVSIFATMTGVGGSAFFSPVFILLLGFEPAVAFGTALCIQVFGFASATFTYYKKRSVDFKLAGFFLLAAVPATLFGAWLSQSLNPDLLRGLFGVWLVIFSVELFYSRLAQRTLVDVVNWDWDVKNSLGLLVVGCGGFLNGLLSTGQSSFSVTYFSLYKKMPLKPMMGTIMAITFVVTIAGALVYAGNLRLNASAVLFAIPAVLLGGQIGPRLARRSHPILLIVLLALGFFFAGIVMLGMLGLKLLG